MADRPTETPGITRRHVLAAGGAVGAAGVLAACGSTNANDALEAFERQMTVATSLRHPCIEAVRDHGEVTLDGERCVYAVSERLAGGSLQDFLDRGRRLTPSQALIVGIDVCRALDAAAKLGFVHGDLRPSKLVFGLDRRVRVVGFGAPLRPLDSLGLDQARYGAPEWGDGGARTVSSDVYSLALVLVEAVTGSVPFDGDSVSAVFANRAGKLFPVNADFGAMAQVLERAGRPTADERHSPRELGQALVEVAQNMPRPTPIDIVGTGLFDVEVDESDPSKPVARPETPVSSEIGPVPNEAPSKPILIRTTPGLPPVDPSGPVVVPMPDGRTGGQPLVIGSDESGPIVVDRASRLVVTYAVTVELVTTPTAPGPTAMCDLVINDEFVSLNGIAEPTGAKAPSNQGEFTLSGTGYIAVAPGTYDIAVLCAKTAVSGQVDFRRGTLTVVAAAS